MPPCIIDIEASGFGAGSYPIEVGAVMHDGSAYCTLIIPEPDWKHWDTQAEHVHGITRQTLQLHGKPAAAVAQALNQQLRGQTVYTDAWYHDYQWLCRLYDAAEMVPAFTLKDLRDILAPEAQAQWHTSRDAVMQELKLSRHRASNDARVLQSTLVRVLQPTPGA
jgi:hypothetical protein